MGCCVIFCAAEFDALARPLEKDDYILAADGGLKHTRKLGIEPNEIIGDFDSLGFTPPGAEVFPVEKDDTDAMLAVRRGLELAGTERENMTTEQLLKVFHEQGVSNDRILFSAES